MPAAALQVRAVEGDASLVEALREGDERAFLRLVERLHAPMLRFARGFLAAEAAAEDVVQDTWAVVLESLDRFEGRSTLKSWIFGILANLARTRAVREGRSVPLSALSGDDDGPAVDASEFLPQTHPRWPGHWARMPEAWPEQQLLSRETLQHLQGAIERLPQAQRTVIQLRDVDGWSAQEVCASLGITEVNQRVLLHRARSRVRRDLPRDRRAR
jgi:RNA polymerase sigma-70 factor (ECF subfamily)